MSSGSIFVRLCYTVNYCDRSLDVYVIASCSRLQSSLTRAWRVSVRRRQLMYNTRLGISKNMFVCISVICVESSLFERCVFSFYFSLTVTKIIPRDNLIIIQPINCLIYYKLDFFFRLHISDVNQFNVLFLLSF